MTKRIFRVYKDRRVWDASHKRSVKREDILKAVIAGEDVVVWEVLPKDPDEPEELRPLPRDITRETLIRALLRQERQDPKLTCEQLCRLIRGEER